MQSYLLGTPEIFVGVKDSEDIVRRFDTLAVRDLAETCQWKIDWGARVLHSLRKYCGRSPGKGKFLKVWRVQARFKRADIRELTGWEVRELNKGGVPRSGIIPLSFIEELESRIQMAAV